jgi:serine/threonine protein kinase
MITGGVGTYNYMPPERLNKKPYEYSADVWALGVLLYAMIAGMYYRIAAPCSGYNMQCAMCNIVPAMIAGMYVVHIYCITAPRLQYTISFPPLLLVRCGYLLPRG